ncbi:bifunctional oligoribonuclease/PAP phosphatase NrnA [Spiroplasma endosymbiont of Aspidapion aeneum]|uniref:DHH family phosphoesterase n=1 Tax=Spiroplasma endosymbiont of Aspidapion aeneum TaxID=3066276 RepID=UPI00313EDD20
MKKEISLIKDILSEIINFEKIICIRHINPDGDAFGSQNGLKKIINYNWPNKKVYACGTNVDFFRSLGQMDQLKEEDFIDALVIITDTGSIPRIDSANWKQAKKVIKIDHHPNENKYGDIQWVDSSFTSASEMIGYFALKCNLKINSDIAQTILFGITTDTNRFISKNVSSRTFDVCSFLMTPKWNIIDLYNRVYTKKLTFLQAQAEVIQNSKVENKVGAIFLTKNIINKYNIPYDQNDIFVNLFQGIEEVEISVSFSANIDETYRVEFRSNKTPLKSIAEKYGGGGHPLIAGATINSLDIAESIIKDLKSIVK